MATGAICWSRRYDHPFFSTPLVAPGRLWASCGDVVHCIDVASGDEIWSYYPEHFSLYGPMVLAQGRLFAPDCDGWTYVLDPENGAFLDRFLLPRGTGLTSDGTLIYAACGVRGLCACDPLSYRELWHIGRPGSYFAGGLALREREILAASSDGNVYAVAGGTGRIAWSFQLGDVGGAAVTFDDEHGYVITGGGQLVAFSLPTC
jgi:outer membrane protein assembly factor BamB